MRREDIGRIVGAEVQKAINEGRRNNLSEDEHDQLICCRVADMTVRFVERTCDEAARFYLTPEEPQEIDEPTGVEQAYQEGFSDACGQYRAKLRAFKDSLSADPREVSEKKGEVNSGRDLG